MDTASENEIGWGKDETTERLKKVSRIELKQKKKIKEQWFK